MLTIFYHHESDSNVRFEHNMVHLQKKSLPYYKNLYDIIKTTIIIHTGLHQVGLPQHSG